MVVFCVMLICLGIQITGFTSVAIQISLILDESVNLIILSMGVAIFVISLFSIPINYINDRF